MSYREETSTCRSTDKVKLNGNIFALATPKYVDISLKLEVMMTGCPT